MALHTGEVVERGGDYFGTAVNRAARLMALAYGGQVLASATTAGLIEVEAPLTDLGEHRLRDLSMPQRVFQVGAASFPALRSPDAVMGNLPAQLSSFVGREEALRDVAAMLGRDRLVTLTGAAGVGKTRLAVQAAAELAGWFGDGAWLVELGGLTSGAEVPAAVGAVLAVPQQPGRSLLASVCGACRYREILVVLDNCEHLVGDVAGLVSELLATAPTARVLATSRQALGVRGERLYPVAPLRTDDEAVALFLDRAQAVKPGFSLTDVNARAVAEVCRHLDGIPLALELAAARVAAMTPEEIYGRLDERFRLLRAGPRSDVHRHQTLRAAIDWSYDALEPRDQQVFEGLAVFVGGFTSDAAQAVLAGEADPWDVLDALESLVDKSLLSTTEHAGATRYQMLETVRHYALERLVGRGTAEQLRGAHAEWVASFVEEQAGPGLRGPQEPQWLQRLGANRDNVATAVEWAARTGHLDLAARIAAGLGWYGAAAYQLGLAEVPEMVLRIPGSEAHPLFPEVAGQVAYALQLRGDTTAVIGLCRRAIAAERNGGPPASLARVSLVLALLHTGEADEAVGLAEDTDAAAVAWGDPWVRVTSRCAVVGTLYNQGSRSVEELAATAAALVEEARETGNPSAIAGSTFQRGAVYSGLDPKAAIRDLEESLGMASGGAEGSGAFHASLMGAIGYLCRCYASVRDEASATAVIRRGVVMARERGSPTMLAQILDYGGQALVTLGHDEEGAALLSAAAGGRIAPRALGGRLLEQRSAAQDAARRRLGEERYARAVAIGADLVPESATAYVLEILERNGAAGAAN
jgi:predicted ATPase